MGPLDETTKRKARCHSWCGSKAVSAKHRSSPSMLASPYEYKVLKRDVKRDTTNERPTIILRNATYSYRIILLLNREVMLI